MSDESRSPGPKDTSTSASTAVDKLIASARADKLIASARADNVERSLDLVAAARQCQDIARRELGVAELHLQEDMIGAAIAGATVRQIAAASGICKSNAAVRVRGYLRRGNNRPGSDALKGFRQEHDDPTGRLALADRVLLAAREVEELPGDSSKIISRDGLYWRVVSDHAVDHPAIRAAIAHAGMTGSVGCTYNEAKVERVEIVPELPDDGQRKS